MVVDSIALAFHVVNLLVVATCIFLSNEVYKYLHNTSLGSSLKVMGAAFGWFLVFEMLNIFNAAGMSEQLSNLIPGVEYLALGSELLFVLMLLYGVYHFKTTFKKFDWLKEIEEL